MATTKTTTKRKQIIYKCKSSDCVSTEILVFRGQITISDEVAVLVPEKELTLEELELLRIKDLCQKAERQEREARKKEANAKRNKRWFDKISVAMAACAMI